MKRLTILLLIILDTQEGAIPKAATETIKDIAESRSNQVASVRDK